MRLRCRWVERAANPDCSSAVPSLYITKGAVRKRTFSRPRRRKVRLARTLRPVLAAQLAEGPSTQSLQRLSRRSVPTNSSSRSRTHTASAGNQAPNRGDTAPPLHRRIDMGNSGETGGSSLRQRCCAFGDNSSGPGARTPWFEPYEKPLSAPSIGSVTLLRLSGASIQYKQGSFKWNQSIGSSRFWSCAAWCR